MTSKATEELTQDDIFEILSNSRRRYLIHTLHQHNGAVELSDLATYTAAWEHGVDIDQIESDQRRRVYISLYQTHLPKLVEYGVVDYDEDANTVSLTDRVDRIDHYLYIDEEPSTRWWLYYASLSVVAVLLLAASWWEVYPVSTVSTELVAQLITAAFFVLAVSHYLVQRTHRRRRFDDPESEPAP